MSLTLLRYNWAFWDLFEPSDKHSDLLAGHRAGINNLYLIENNKYVTKEKELFSKTILNKVSDVLKYL